MFLYLLVTISGFSSLIYEIVWMRSLSLIYGNTTHATGMILALFMGGLAIGALAFGRMLVTRPVRTYGLLEGAIGVWGLMATVALDWIRQAYAGVAGIAVVDAVVQASLLAILILPPTIMMGASLPLLLRARADFERRGIVSGMVYGMNTAGGLAGALGAGFLFIPLLGLHATVQIAVAGNLFVCLAAWFVREIPGPTEVAAAIDRRPERSILIAYGLCGFSSLALEVIWTRILVLEIGSSVYAYSLLLVTFLMGVAVGSIIGGYVSDRIRGSLPVVLAFLEVALAFSVFSQYWLLEGFGMRTGAMEAFFWSLGPFAAQSVALFLNATQFVIIPTVIMGVSFPLLLRACSTKPGTEQSHAGHLYLANTAGGVAGSLAASFALIPAVGVHRAMCAAAAVNVVAAFLLARRSPGRKPLTVAAGVALVAGVVLAWQPSILMRSDLFRESSDRRLIDFAEDQTSTVSVEEIMGPPSWRSISVNGVNVAGTSPDLLDIQAMQGHLPLLLAAGAERVLHIGFGSGGTAYAVSTHRVKTIRVAEISPAVIELSGKHFPDVNRGVLRDPRLSIWYGDGRNFLLRTREQFDVILSDSIHPRYCGNGSLYTREYYQLCRSRLTPGGVVSQWLPLYTLTPDNFQMILKAFLDVFPETTVWYVHTTLNPFTVVVGRNAGGSPVRLADLVREAQQTQVAAHLRERGHADPVAILGYFVAGGGKLASLLESVPAHTDDLPLVEYESGRLTGRDTWRDNFQFLLKAREPVWSSLDTSGLAGMEELERTLIENYRAVGKVLERQAALLRIRGVPAPVP